jgi:hypothetical protein
MSDDVRARLRAQIEARKGQPVDPNDPAARYERGLAKLEAFTASLKEERSPRWGMSREDACALFGYDDVW